MKIKLSKLQWENMGKKAGWFSPNVPGENEFGHGLNQEAMGLLKQYDITATNLFKYDDPSSSFQDIYQGIQGAKQGNIESLRMALEGRFGKKKWFQKNI